MADEQPRRPRLKYLDPNYDKTKRSKKHEERLGKRLGGKRLPRSGGLSWSKWDDTSAKGDISTPDFHIEHKRTEAKSMTVQLDWLVKVSEGARRVGKDPALGITFEKDGAAPCDWIALPLDVFERLCRTVKAAENGAEEPSPAAP